MVHEDVSFAVCRIEHPAHNSGGSGLWIVWPPIHNTSHCRSFCELLGSSESDLNSKSMHTIIISPNYLMFALRLIEFFMIHFLSLSCQACVWRVRSACAAPPCSMHAGRDPALNGGETLIFKSVVAHHQSYCLLPQVQKSLFALIANIVCTLPWVCLDDAKVDYIWKTECTKSNWRRQKCYICHVWKGL